MKNFYDIKNGLVWENYYFVPAQTEIEDKLDTL